MRLDYSDRQTEKELNDLEKRIANLYADAYKSIKVEAEAYFADFESEFAVMQKKHVNGDMSKDEFLNWYHTAVTKGTRYNNLINDFANRITDANKIATTYINDTTPGLYALNANYDAYKISAATGYSFSVYDESTVRRLAMQDEIRLPKTKINDAKDLAYNRQKLNRCVTSGILRGVPVQQIAREFGQATNSGYHSAIRAARTAVTGAQNAGRLDTMYRAKDMGIDVLKEWMATKDNRTRDSHGKLDGERREPEEAFSNKCMMPGDPDGPGAEVWNCRCAMTYILPGINDADPRETYSEWMAKQRPVDSDEDYTSKDVEINFSKLTPKGLAIISETDPHKQMQLIQNYLYEELPEGKSSWSGNVIENPEFHTVAGFYRRTGDIIERNLQNTPIKTRVHEMAHSFTDYSSYSLREAVRNSKLNEGAIELFAREFCERNGIGYRGTYSEYVNAINNIASGLNVDNMTLAKALVTTPYSERYGLLESLINSKDSEAPGTKAKLERDMLTLWGKHQKKK